jgi:hypothetical protein
MTHSSVKLKTLSLFERKEYEELKLRYSYDAKRLRKNKVFLGLAIVTFVATLAVSGVFN